MINWIVKGADPVKQMPPDRSHSHLLRCRYATITFCTLPHLTHLTVLPHRFPPLLTAVLLSSLLVDCCYYCVAITTVQRDRADVHE